MVKKIPYRGPQIPTLESHTGMLAHDNVTKKRYLLAVEVPGMLENRPVVVYGSRVHVTYKARLPDALMLSHTCLRSLNVFHIPHPRAVLSMASAANVIRVHRR